MDNVNCVTIKETSSVELTAIQPFERGKNKQINLQWKWLNAEDESSMKGDCSWITDGRTARKMKCARACVWTNYAQQGVDLRALPFTFALYQITAIDGDITPLINIQTRYSFCLIACWLRLGLPKTCTCGTYRHFSHTVLLFGNAQHKQCTRLMVRMSTQMNQSFSGFCLPSIERYQQQSSDQT